jgi:hypothetical protein
MAGLIDFSSFLTPIVQKLADFIPDPAARAKAAAEAEAQLLQFQNSQNLQQLKVDEAEANNKNLFVAGWRPFIGWCGGAALAWSTIGNPFANWIIQVIHPGAAYIPSVPTGNIEQIVFAMLGLGGMRTYEKMRGVAPKGAR